MLNYGIFEFKVFMFFVVYLNKGLLLFILLFFFVMFKYKLIYFLIRGRVEFIWILFVLVGVEFEDI